MTVIETYLLTPIKDIFFTVVSFIPTIITVVAILLLGYYLAKIIREILHKILSEVHLDKGMEKLGLSRFLHAGGKKYSVTHVITGVIDLIVIVTFLIVTVGVLGIVTIPALISSLMGYATKVITAVMVLVVGTVLAKIVGKIVYLVVNNFGLPQPKLHERVSRWAILVYTIKMSLVELGYGVLFSGPVFLMLMGGLVVALALAFGLGGREMAAKYLSTK